MQIQTDLTKASHRRCQVLKASHHRTILGFFRFIAAFLCCSQSR